MLDYVTQVQTQTFACSKGRVHIYAFDRAYADGSRQDRHYSIRTLPPSANENTAFYRGELLYVGSDEAEAIAAALTVLKHRVQLTTQMRPKMAKLFFPSLLADVTKFRKAYRSMGRGMNAAINDFETRLKRREHIAELHVRIDAEEADKQ